MKADLNKWIAIWHPQYRWMLVQLLIIGFVVGGLVYLENTLLHGLVESLTETEAADEGLAARLLRLVSGGSGLPFAFLGAIFVAGIIRAVISARRDIVSSRMVIQSRDDLEQQVLYHLLNREDEFFAEHSPGEIMNRLEVDLYRILERRETMVDIFWCGLMILANLIFFGLADWRLAIVVVVICVVGTLFTERVSKPVQSADHKYFQSNDQVKMDFEDYLKAIPEIQVGGLHRSILNRFRKPQTSRFEAFMDWVRAYTKVEFSRSAWPVVAFLITVLIVLYAHRSADGTDASGLALIPVLIFALPSIFSNVTALVTLRINFKLADNSVKRILEYQRQGLAELVDEEPTTHETDGTDLGVDVSGATYQYPSPDGGLQGGISEVTTVFEAGKWSAIIGGAGSGKSTLVNMVLGRLEPQAGHVRMGQTDVADAGPDYVSQVATLMPQRVVLFDSSIRANLLLGQRGNIEGYRFTREDLTILEDLGLGAICRLKALEMRPEKTEWSLDDSELLELRRLARERATELHVGLAPFEEDRIDPRRSVFDALVGGRTDGERALGPLLAGDKPAWLATISGSELGEELRRQAQVVLDESRNLLELPSFADFASLSPDNLDERVWSLRRSCMRALEASADAPLDRMRLTRVGLTCAPSEWGADQSAADELFNDLRRRFTDEIDGLRSVVQDVWEPFHADSIHPFLPWRDNLLFASADVANQRRRRKLDAMLMELMEGERWSTFFVSQGLAFQVGRNGSRLSGGQGQLVSLARSVLRRTPLLVLDEPTSALDPASRDRVADFLRSWCANRVVITISHDSEFTRRADEVHVVGAGRFVSRGSFSELSKSCETFRKVFRIE